MNKTALISWMGFIEAAVRVASRSGPDESLKRAAEARETFAADANCASIKDPSDTPPPSSWPSVSRIRKETRAEVVAEIVAYLESDAAKFRTSRASTTGAHDSIVANAFEAAARVIRGKFA